MSVRSAVCIAALSLPLAKRSSCVGPDSDGRCITMLWSPCRGGRAHALRRSFLRSLRSGRIA
eukprot:14536652-Alexandrium_andersonii.AAC.1